MQWQSKAKGQNPSESYDDDRCCWKRTLVHFRSRFSPIPLPTDKKVVDPAISPQDSLTVTRTLAIDILKPASTVIRLQLPGVDIEIKL